jgi:hypothetical protein
MKRRKEVGRLDIENPKCKWHKTVYLEDGKLMKTIHDGSFTPVEPEPEMLPLYFEGRQINSHVGVVSTLETAPNLEWCWDNKNWKPWPYTTIDGEHRFDPLLLSAVGDRIYVRGNNPDGLAFMQEDAEMPSFTSFAIDGSVSAGGNIMSLLDKTMELTEVPDLGFMGLFAIMDEDVEPVLLTPPSMDTITSIGYGGCTGMYGGCTSLTAAAAMPAVTTIGEQGCSDMYIGCTSLTAAAAMPAVTTIGEQGCSDMYIGCTSLTAAADMPSLTTIGDHGCTGMYGGCTSLTAAAAMPAVTTIGEQGCTGMYGGCTSLTAAADMPSLTTIGDHGCDGMYYGCTFNMSDDGTTLNFAFPTPPVTAGENTYSTAYDVAQWMGNTNGFENQSNV